MLSRKEKMARRERRQRMAGEELQTGTPEANEAAESVVAAAEESDLSARDEGFKNSLERNIGKEEYSRLGAEGLQGGDNRGQYQAREVISEYRNGGKSIDEMTDYFQGLANDGTKFNKRAVDFLTKKGVTFGGGDGGGGEDPGDTVTLPTPVPSPGPSPTPGPDPLPTPQPTPTPIPNPDPFPMPPGIPGGPGGGFNVGRDLIQNVGKVGDTNTTIGDGNTIGNGTRIGGDYSITLGNNHAGNNGYYRSY